MSDIRVVVANYTVTCNGDTEAGEEFCDGFLPVYNVIDSGVIVIKRDDLDTFIEAARKADLTVEVEAAA